MEDGRNRRMTIDEAVERLRQGYAKAKEDSNILNPLAYALWKVWWEASKDVQEEKYEEEEE